LLGIVACGLMAYGVYEIAAAWLRRPSIAARREMTRNRKSTG
jgi:hypothetical protein